MTSIAAAGGDVSIGKYVTNFSVIGALFGAIGAYRQTQTMPKDWRRFVVWGVWAAGLALAIGGVAKQASDAAFAEEQYEREQEARALVKAQRAAARRR